MHRDEKLIRSKDILKDPGKQIRFQKFTHHLLTVNVHYKEIADLLCFVFVFNHFKGNDIKPISLF